ncbi:MAG: MBL fold metallo-hydrolase [Verrucomicrobiota bacterium]|nr:MBL fold metallo-hydrolase [Verrucomicrobiota bacterium]
MTTFVQSINQLEEAFLVGFWGTRGSVPTPGRVTEKYGGNTSCVHIEVDNTILIFDAGTGIRNFGIELKRRDLLNKPDTSLHIFLSHTHWDHIQGLPFFEPAYMPDVNIVIYGAAKRGKFLEKILRGQMDQNYFPVEMSAFSSNLQIREITGNSVSVGSLKIGVQELIHPGGSLAYKVNHKGKTCIYATDNELNILYTYEEKNGSPHPQKAAIMDFFRNADLLIADGQYTSEEYKEGWGHTSLNILTKFAYSVGVKKMAVFHHDPLHTDAILDKFASEYSVKYNSMTPPMEIFWAREGMIIGV